MKQKFTEKSFSDVSESLIAQINTILDSYGADGYVLSLRQLYYQLVSRDMIVNTLRSYKRIVDIVTNARLAGRIDWSMITDRGRSTAINSHWNNPAEIIRACADQYAIDKWATQPNYVEVEVEKDALSGILEPVCRELDVAFAANKGYSSISAMYVAGRRLRGHGAAGKHVHILYLGDHDPSGIDMTRDVTDRLGMFSAIDITVQRLALNYSQVKELNPPENPAKESDSRYAGYAAEFGESSWELDAIEPRALAELVRSAVLALRDENLWGMAMEKEGYERNKIEKYALMARREADGG